MRVRTGMKKLYSRKEKAEEIRVGLFFVEKEIHQDEEKHWEQEGKSREDYVHRNKPIKGTVIRKPGVHPGDSQQEVGKFLDLGT